jgi:cation diffusion facilitator family transporter
LFESLIAVRRRLQRFLRPNTPAYASTTSLAACILLALVSLLLGQREQSLVMQTNGYIALIDIGNSLLFLAAVDRSTRSPDLTFNYGYGKYESLAILVSANLLFGLTIVTIVQAIGLLQSPPENTNTPLLLAWSALAFLVMRGTARRLERYANRFHQPMLRYDAELWRVDSWVEIGVVIGVVLDGVLQAVGWFSTAAVADAVASVTLLVLTLKAPLQHGVAAFRQLTDRTLPDDMQYEILGIIAGEHHRMCEFKSVHTRQSGRDIFIEIDLVMPYDYRLDQMYPLEEELLVQLRSRFPTAIPRVYVTPCDRSCEHANGSTCPVKRAFSTPQSAPSG